MVLFPTSGVNQGEYFCHERRRTSGGWEESSPALKSELEVCINVTQPTGSIEYVLREQAIKSRGCV
jgi:hypothetical protein